MKKKCFQGIGSLGGLEIIILPYIWRGGKVKIKDVFEAMYEKHKLTYTTIMSVFNRLVDKGVLEQDRSVIPHVFNAKVSQKEMAEKMVGEIIEKLLDGDPAIVFEYLNKNYGSNIKQVKNKTREIVEV